jgi:hypothetical protein
MTKRNLADEGVGAGDVFVQCIENAGLPGFEFSGQGDNRVLQGRRRRPEESALKIMHLRLSAQNL